MSDLYKTIEGLCAKRGVSITVMCKESGASRGSITDLKMGRINTLHSNTLRKIAEYLDVSVDYLLGNETQQADPRKVTDEDLKFALFGGDGDITDEMFDEVKRFAEFVKKKNERK